MKLIILDFQGTLIDHSDPPQLFPGTMDCLKILKTRFLLALVTEGKAINNLTFLLQTLGIHQFFDYIFHAKNTDFTKLNGSAYSQMLTLTGITAEETIVIGDHPLADIKGAHAAGLRAIRLVQGKYSSLAATDHLEEADAQFDSLQSCVFSIINNA